MDSYFALNGTGESGTCYAPKGLHCCDLPTPGELVAEWEPLPFRLRGDRFADFHGTNLLGWNVFSPRLKGIIETVCSAQDNIFWLPITAVSEIGERRNLYLLHHTKLIEALDAEKARYLDANRQILIGPVLKADALGARHLFTVPEAKHVTYVSQLLKEAIEAEQCTGGIVFLRVTIS